MQIANWCAKNALACEKNHREQGETQIKLRNRQGNHKLTCEQSEAQM